MDETMEMKQRRVKPAPTTVAQPEERSKDKVVLQDTQQALYLLLTRFRYMIIFFTILSFCLKVIYIHSPDEVVFDEVHFGKFASYYLRNEYYFDVHPPLGKLLLAGVGYLVGYDGHFLFDKIGDNYVENQVPYVAFRSWCALCGALVTPFSMLILKELKVSTLSCFLGGVLMVFDTALTTQSRMILLDSMLLLFCTMAIYFWVKFQSHRHEAFTFAWWTWLTLTGVGLALVMGVKMVGLFTVATVGIATLTDLWYYLDIRKGYSMTYFTKQFAARALCLIIIPIILYLIPFYIHFKVLYKTGSGDKFMSLRFQETLQGNLRTAGSTTIPYHSHVTFQHIKTNHYLHSHEHRYPLKHEDGKISSQGQQVNGYAHSDANSYWEILPVDPKHYPDTPTLDEDEKEFNIRYLRNLDAIRLRHVGTDKYLCTHDVASPLTTTNMEVTAITFEEAELRYTDTVWIIQLGNSKDDPRRLNSKKDDIFIQNAHFDVALHTNKKLLPAWGFKMQEINGNKKMEENSNLWTVDSVKHESIPEVMQEPEKPKPLGSVMFLAKFFELQGLMISHNSALKKSHPYSSEPISWPFALRGISFWEKEKGWRQIYLLSNPFGWAFAIIGPFLFATMWIMDRIFLQRGIDDLGPCLRRFWDRSIGFLFMTWLLHYAPFFLMGRMLFLHHYLPAYIFSVLLSVLFVDVLARDFMSPKLNYPANTRIGVWRSTTNGLGYTLFVILIAGLVIFGFVYFAPLAYGLGFPSREVLQTRKWLRSWDLQYAK